MDDGRDMFYSGYGYGMTPMPNNMMPTGNIGGSNMMPNNSMPNQGNYMTSWNNDINNRIDKLERQVNRLETRITRLETPYQNKTNVNTDDVSNMYMM